MERDHGALLAAEPAITPIQVQVRFFGFWAGDGVGQPHAQKQVPARPNGTANANLP